MPNRPAGIETSDLSVGVIRPRQTNQPGVAIEEAVGALHFAPVERQDAAEAPHERAEAIEAELQRQ
ncbi:MAG: hypothetical protein PGN09_12625 [Sphingomonas fennica]